MDSLVTVAMGAAVGCVAQGAGIIPYKQKDAYKPSIEVESAVIFHAVKNVLFCWKFQKTTKNIWQHDSSTFNFEKLLNRELPIEYQVYEFIT